MIILILWKWPGAILTFFCLILSLAVNTTYASPAQVDANGLVSLSNSVLFRKVLLNRKVIDTSMLIFTKR